MKTVTVGAPGNQIGQLEVKVRQGVAFLKTLNPTLWPSAVSIQPEDNVGFTRTSPWLGFRIGVIGDLTTSRRYPTCNRPAHRATTRGPSDPQQGPVTHGG